MSASWTVAESHRGPSISETGLTPLRSDVIVLSNRSEERLACSLNAISLTTSCGERP